MRRALRRLASILLTLLATSLAALWALALLADEFGSACSGCPPTAGSQTAERRERAPRFFNPEPRSARKLAALAIDALALARGDHERAARELARLGGAALPHVLSRLDTLSPVVRGRVALALSPVAGRMGIASTSDFASPEAAILFWTRFWQDRAMDFRPQLVRRLVSRLAQKSSVLRNEDVIQLDTYALPELVTALEPVTDREGVQRAHRLTLVLAHVTGEPWTVKSSASIGQANDVIAHWQRFWLESGADYSTPEGARQVTAMFAETQYGRWLRGLAATSGIERFGLTPSQFVPSVLRATASVTVALLIAMVLARALSGRSGTRVSLVLATVPLVFASAPVAAWIPLFGRPSAAPMRELACVLIAGAGGGSVLALVVSRALVRDLVGNTRTALSHAALVLPSILPWLFASLMLLEDALELDSAARAALRGVLGGDLRPGMALALGSSLAVAVLTATAARFAAWSSSSAARPTLLEVGGSRSRRVRLAALAWFGLLLALALASLRARTDLGAITRALAVYAVVSTVVAGLVGLGLGALRGRRQRSLDSVLARAVEVQAALPGVIWAAAFGALLGGGLRLALALGALRALDVAWVYRTELARASFELRGYADGGERGTGRPTPVPLSSRARLAVNGPALAALALTPAWAVGMGAAVTALGLSPAHEGWGLLAIPTGAPQVAFVLLVLVTTTSAALLGGIAPMPRKLGALRSSRPPPPEHSPSEPPPSSERIPPPWR